MIILAFVLGAAIGSFAHAAIWRTRRKTGLAMTGRSACEHCGHRLGAAELVPIVSWLALRGRCRHCRHPIAWRHPAVEAGAGVLFALAAAVAG